jgi:uncharacterized protein (DUF983 family)
MRFLGFSLFAIAAAVVVLGVSVVVMALTAPSGEEAPRWVHALSALPLFIAALFLAAFGSFLKQRGGQNRR